MQPAADDSSITREQALRRRGVWELVAAAALFSVMSLLVKKAGEELPSQMIVMGRAVVTLVMSYAWIRAAGLSARGNAHGWLIVRGVFGFLGLMCFFYAVTHLPLAEATVLHFLNPIFTVIIAAVVLKEGVGAVLLVGLLLGLCGTALVLQPTTTVLDHTGVLAALGGAIASAFAYVTVRHLRGTDDPLVVVFWFSIVAVPAAIPFVVPVFEWPTPRGWVLLAAVGVVTQLGQVCITRGLSKVEAGPATTIGYLQIAFAALWGVLVFGEPLAPTTLLGAGLVFAGTAIVALWPRRWGGTGRPPQVPPGVA